ncbi:unnamed protein product [Lepidochelys olivacea]
MPTHRSVPSRPLPAGSRCPVLHGPVAASYYNLPVHPVQGGGWSLTGVPGPCDDTNNCCSSAHSSGRRSPVPPSAARSPPPALKPLLQLTHLQQGWEPCRI